MDLNKKNKIAFLITGLQAGGAERVISNLANNFAEKNYDVKIIVMKKAVSDYALNPILQEQMLLVKKEKIIS